MTDNELLLAISDIMDKKLQPLKEEIKQLKLQNENIIIPRLQNIENCYTSTYDRYKNSVEELWSYESRYTNYEAGYTRT